MRAGGVAVDAQRGGGGCAARWQWVRGAAVGACAAVDDRAARRRWMRSAAAVMWRCAVVPDKAVVEGDRRATLLDQPSPAFVLFHCVS
jgi:hypothetical protein